MSDVKSKNALPTMGAIYVTISFSVYEIQNKKFISDGNSQFVFNVREHRKEILKGAIYNAIKREFPNRTVTAYDIIILDYYYSYFVRNYKITSENDKVYESYVDEETRQSKKFLKNRYELKETYVGDFNTNEGYNGGK